MFSCSSSGHTMYDQIDVNTTLCDTHAMWIVDMWNVDMYDQTDVYCLHNHIGTYSFIRKVRWALSEV